MTGPAPLSPKEQGLLGLAAAGRAGDPVAGLPAAGPGARAPRALPLWLLLVGRAAVHRRWGFVAGVGLVWTGLGGALVIDALDGATHVPTAGSACSSWSRR